MRMYGDAKFAKLSPLLPSGQSLWLYLLTGPHTGAIPGVFVIGRAAMAEALDWAIEAFDKAFAEVLAQGMVEFDAKSRLWFIPKAIQHNQPASPNVVRSWRAQWAVLPECALRERIAEALDDALGEPYAAAFAEVSGKPSTKTCAKPLQEASAKASSNQEQEQEQEKEKTSSSSSSGPTSGRPTVPCPYDAIVAAYNEILVPPLPRVRLRTRDRETAMRKRWGWIFSDKKSDGSARATNADEALGWIREYFTLATENDFLMGRIQRTAEHSNWRCDLDYLLTDRALKQVIEKTRSAA
jgi:hypothetical protein